MYGYFNTTVLFKFRTRKQRSCEYDQIIFPELIILDSWSLIIGYTKTTFEEQIKIPSVSK